MVTLTGISASQVRPVGLQGGFKQGSQPGTADILWCGDCPVYSTLLVTTSVSRPCPLSPCPAKNHRAGESQDWVQWECRARTRVATRSALGPQASPPGPPSPGAAGSHTALTRLCCWGGRVRGPRIKARKLCTRQGKRWRAGPVVGISCVFGYAGGEC